MVYAITRRLLSLPTLLLRSEVSKDAELLVPRHENAVLRRQVPRVRYEPADRLWFTALSHLIPRRRWRDRAFLAALLHRLPRDVLRRVRLLIRPDTVLRWHATWPHAAVSRPKRPGRPRTVRSIRPLVLRLARENPNWGFRRIHGELFVLGVKVTASTVWEILKDAGIDPAPERASSTWADSLRSQADALLACDFLETVTLTGAQLYVFAVIEHASRRIRILGATPHPTTTWVTQAAKNLVMDLEDAHCRARFLIRDRDGKFPALFDTPRRRRNPGGAQRRTSTAHERDHGTLGPYLPPREDRHAA